MKAMTAPNAQGNVIQISEHLPPPQKVASQYDRYPLPFFNASKLCTWDVVPTGDYGVDCKTGRKYAIEFLRSCDGTYGWASLLQQIVADMIGADRQSRMCLGFHTPQARPGTRNVGLIPPP